ncbi:MAG TPA: PAS domain S-box protein [Dissulfurispiraceae bacterium]
MDDVTKTLQEQPSRTVLGARTAEGRDFRELYQQLIEAAPDAMVFVERSGRIALVNNEMEKLFGYSREELIGRDLHMLIPERYREIHRKNLAGFFATPRRRPMGSGLKIYGLKKDGAEFRADVSLSPLDIGGEVLVTAAIRDITERVRAEEQIEFDYQIQRVISTILKIALEPISLEEQLQRSLELITSIPDPELEAKGMIYLLDKDTDKFVLKAHRGFTETEEAPPADTPAQTPPCAAPGASCALTPTGNADAPYEVFYRQGPSFVHYCMTINEGEKILGLISVFAKDWPGTRPQEEVFFRAVAHTLAVIIKRAQIEDERRRLLDQLAQTEKLAALGRISANVAHEIRNPLTVVGGFARRLQKGTADAAREREYAGFIVSEVNRLEDILKEILAFARTTVLHVKEYPLTEILDETLGMYEEACRERSISVRRSYESTGEVALDKIRAREVVGNIVSNAVDAMPHGGMLTVATAQERMNGGFYAAVKISDTGEGIPADKIQKIFEPFFTTKVAAKGIGLGLSISKKIMEDHGGFITAESANGKGSTFTLYFPLKTKA